MKFDYDEKMVLMLYGEESREKTMEALKSMKELLTLEETELNHIIESILQKLTAMTDTEFASIDLYVGLLL